MNGLTRPQQAAVILLRTLIGWHFLYEGLYKLLLPGWSRGGQPVKGWTAAGYLANVDGPFASWFQRLAQPPAIAWIDVLVPVSLAAIGVSLMLGLFTRVGCAAAALFLALVYAAAIPTSGLPQAGTEGAYLIVSKNLIELAAVITVATFDTGRIAGLDLLWSRRRLRTPFPDAAASATLRRTRSGPELDRGRTRPERALP